MRVRRRRGDEHHRVATAAAAQGRGVGVQRARPRARAHHAQAKVGRRLVVCRVRVLAQHNLWVGHAAARARKVSGRLDRHQDGLRAARRHVAHHARGTHIAVQQRGTHGHHLRLGALGTGKQVAVQRVGVQEARHRLADELLVGGHGVAAHVHRATCLALPRCVHLRHSVERASHRLGAQARLGQREVGALSRGLVLVHLGEHLGLFFRLVRGDWRQRGCGVDGRLRGRLAQPLGAHGLLCRQQRTHGVQRRQRRRGACDRVGQRLIAHAAGRERRVAVRASARQGARKPLHAAGRRSLRNLNAQRRGGA
mmetsp:Transcript_6635/g.20063  ORF Transcript_6635/g.20063 Transcript_6635/m.20063 type:complete len:310 (+) Transcript_6635:1229-2158(+)